MPKEKVVYFGDTIHLPYGENQKTNSKFSLKIIDFLIDKVPKLL